jgi:hypothetical protein
MSVQINHFAKRQTAASRYSHYEPRLGFASDSPQAWAELEALINEAFEKYSGDKSRLTAVSENGLVLKLALPEESCQGFYSGVILADETTVFKTSFGKRERAVEGELPSIHVSALSGRKAKAVAVDVIVYHVSQLSLDERTYIDDNGATVVENAEWQVVSINARDTVNPEPPTPLAMARNMAALLEMPEGVGGSARGYTAEQFVEAILYWSRRTMSPGQ